MRDNLMFFVFAFVITLAIVIRVANKHHTEKQKQRGVSMGFWDKKNQTRLKSKIAMDKKQPKRTFSSHYSNDRPK